MDEYYLRLGLLDRRVTALEAHLRAEKTPDWRERTGAPRCKHCGKLEVEHGYRDGINPPSCLGDRTDNTAFDPAPPEPAPAKPALCSTCNGTRTVHFGGRFVLCPDCDPSFTTIIAAVADALPVEPQIGADAREKVKPMRADEPAPVPMLLFCPRCGTQHIDAPEPDTGWTNPPHRSHKCNCGCIWRPADVPTDGVVSIRTRGSADTWSATWTDGVTRARPAPAPDAGALEAAQRIVDAGEPSPYDPYDHELYEQAKRRIVELEAIRRDLNRSLEVDNATAAKLAEELDKARGAFEAMRLMYQDATASAKRAEAALETVRAECEAMRAVCKQWKPVVDAALVARETSNNLMDLWEAVQALRAAQGTE